MSDGEDPSVRAALIARSTAVIQRRAAGLYLLAAVLTVVVGELEALVKALF
jgi:hypothetical protein